MNSWLNHVKAYSKSHDGKFSLKAAAASYKKGSSSSSSSSSSGGRRRDSKGRYI
jgi:hypothetical protein